MCVCLCVGRLEGGMGDRDVKEERWPKRAGGMRIQREVLSGEIQTRVTENGNAKKLNTLQKLEKRTEN